MNMSLESWEKSFQRILRLLDDKEPFSFSRWGDGEWIALLRVEPKWKEDLKNIKLVSCGLHRARFEDMSHTLRNVLIQRPSYLLGLQPYCINKEARRPGTIFDKNPIEDFMERHGLRGLKWVNADALHLASKQGDLGPFVELCRKRSVVLIGPKHIERIAHRIGVIKHVLVPSMDCWMKYAEILGRAKAALDEAPKEAIICCSAGPPAKILLDDLHKEFGDRSFVDTGALWDVFAGLRTRTYHNRVDLAQIS